MLQAREQRPPGACHAAGCGQHQAARALERQCPRQHEGRARTVAAIQETRYSPRSRARRLGQPARGSGKSGPNTSFIRTRRSAITRSREGSSLRPDCTRSTAPTKDASNSKCVRRPFPPQTEVQEKLMLCRPFDSGGGIRTRDLRVMRAPRCGYLSVDLQGFRDLARGCVRLNLPVLLDGLLDGFGCAGTSCSGPGKGTPGSAPESAVGIMPGCSCRTPNSL